MHTDGNGKSMPHESHLWSVALDYTKHTFQCAKHNLVHFIGWLAVIVIVICMCFIKQLAMHTVYIMMFIIMAILLVLTDPWVYHSIRAKRIP